MKNAASIVALGGLWFVAVVFLGFVTRVLFEVASLGWNLWP